MFLPFPLLFAFPTFGLLPPSPLLPPFTPLPTTILSRRHRHRLCPRHPRRSGVGRWGKRTPEGLREHALLLLFDECELLGHILGVVTAAGPPVDILVLRPAAAKGHHGRAQVMVLLVVAHGTDVVPLELVGAAAGATARRFHRQALVAPHGDGGGSVREEKDR